MIEAVVNKAKSPYNPVRAVSLHLVYERCKTSHLDKGLGGHRPALTGRDISRLLGRGPGPDFTLPTEAAYVPPTATSRSGWSAEPPAGHHDQPVPGAPRPTRSDADLLDQCSLSRGHLGAPPRRRPRSPQRPPPLPGHTSTTTAKPSEATSTTPAYDPRPVEYGKGEMKVT